MIQQMWNSKSCLENTISMMLKRNDETNRFFLLFSLAFCNFVQSLSADSSDALHEFSMWNTYSVWIYHWSFITILYRVITPKFKLQSVNVQTMQDLFERLNPTFNSFMLLRICKNANLFVCFFPFVWWNLSLGEINGKLNPYFEFYSM